jgi:hypothetical protein
MLLIVAFPAFIIIIVLMSIHFLFYIFTIIPAQMLHNVPAVYDVGGGIIGLCEAKTAAANLPE